MRHASEVEGTPWPYIATGVFWAAIALVWWLA